MVILALVIILWMKMHQSGTLKEMPQWRQLIFRMLAVLAALILCVILVFAVLVAADRFTSLKIRRTRQARSGYRWVTYEFPNTLILSLFDVG